MIRKESTALGVGLLESALEREGRKGCSPILCTDPVAVEPLYQRFDAAHILNPSREAKAPAPPASPAELGWVTFNIYPAEEDLLSIGWMETMLRALAVLQGPLAFELHATNGLVWVRFAVPQEQVPGFRAALLGHFPALALEQVQEPFPQDGLAAVNELYPVGPYHRSLSLLGKEGASPLGLAVQTMTELGPEETGLFQVLLSPAAPGHDWHYNVENMAEAETKAAHLAQLGGLSTDFSYDDVLPPRLDPAAAEKVKVDVAFFATLTRYAAWNTNPEKTEEFLQGMRVATGMLRFGGRAWRLLQHKDLEETLGAEKVERMVTHRLSHRPGVMLTSREVASLAHIPNARALSMLATIQKRTGWQWAPPTKDKDGKKAGGAACLGVNDFAGQTTPVEIPMRVRLRHMYIVGTTGSGKSKLLERLAVDDAQQGVGFCLVDPHGDLCHDILTRLPKERLRDLVYVSFSEDGLVPRWNPFRAKVPSGKLADDMARAFLAQTTSTGARMEHNFRMLAYITHALQGTLDDFAELAARTPRGETLRKQAQEEISNPQVQRFLRNELPKYSPRELYSVTNKLSRLLLDDSLGAMFRQPKNELDPREWMDQARVVLVNLSSGHIGSDHARFVGSLLVSLIYRAALSRTELPENKRRPFVLYVDEFQALQAATLPEILSEGRKYGLAAVLAHQERGQLGKDVAHALGNAAVKVLFRPSEDDVPHYHRITGGSVDADTFRSLGVGQAILACEGRLASLRTELCTAPRLRNPRSAARRYAKRNYHALTETNENRDGVRGVRRPRVYDTFGDASD